MRLGEGDYSSYKVAIAAVNVAVLHYRTTAVPTVTVSWKEPASYKGKLRLFERWSLVSEPASEHAPSPCFCGWLVQLSEGRGKGITKAVRIGSIWA